MKRCKKNAHLVGLEACCKKCVVPRNDRRRSSRETRPDVRREALPRAGPADPPVRAGKGRRREAALSLPLSRAPRLLVRLSRVALSNGHVEVHPTHGGKLLGIDQLRNRTRPRRLTFPPQLSRAPRLLVPWARSRNL